MIVQQKWLFIVLIYCGACLVVYPFVIRGIAGRKAHRRCLKGFAFALLLLGTSVLLQVFKRWSFLSVLFDILGVTAFVLGSIKGGALVYAFPFAVARYGRKATERFIGEQAARFASGKQTNGIAGDWGQPSRSKKRDTDGSD